MNTYYYNLIAQFTDRTWEDLTNDQKDTLINSYILCKNIRFPNTDEFKQAMLDLFAGKKHVTVEYIRYVIFQAIKDEIEMDLDKEWMYSQEDDEEDMWQWQQQQEEQIQQEYQQFVM